MSDDQDRALGACDLVVAWILDASDAELAALATNEDHRAARATEQAIGDMLSRSALDHRKRYSGRRLPGAPYPLRLVEAEQALVGAPSNMAADVGRRPRGKRGAAGRAGTQSPLSPDGGQSLHSARRPRVPIGDDE